mgnify:CR=1 FL=1
MLYCLVCLDKENAIETRMANREDHLKYVVETDVVKYAGPFLSENEDMIGSLIVIDVEDRAEAEKWSETFDCIKSLEVIPNAGHCPHDEMPEKVNPILEKIIQEAI